MDADTRDFLETMQKSIDEVKRDVRDGFKEIRTADYLKRADCERIRQGECKDKFEGIETTQAELKRTVDGINKVVWKGLGAVAVLILLAEFILRQIK